MKKVIVAIIFVLVGTTLLFAKAKEMQFRLVVPEKEAKSASGKKFSFVAHRGEKPRKVLLATEAFLSNKDIESMVITKKEDNQLAAFPRIDIICTKEGARKLQDVLEKNIRNTIAILVDNEVLMMPYILNPLPKGRIPLTSWKISTNEAAEKFVSDLGFTPTFQSGAPVSK